MHRRLDKDESVQYTEKTETFRPLGTTVTKRTTIKDIAKMAGVSLGSVHCALTGKNGVGEATRKRILDIAKKADYRPNAMAASLKRKTVRIAAAFPESTDRNRYYYQHVWNGVRDYMRTVRDFNLDYVEFPFSRDMLDRDVEIAGLADLGKIDGLLTVGFMDDFGHDMPTKLSGLRLPVILVGEDLPYSNRLCCVQPDYQIIGRTMAELIVRQIPENAPILICAGNVSMQSHYLVVQGFDIYMRENRRENPVYKVHSESMSDEDHARILDEIRRRTDVAACAAVNARGSVMLGRALVKAGRAGKVVAVGSDVFEENIDFLREGVFTNLVHKNPHHQSYIAAKLLVDHLLRDAQPESEVVYVGSEVIFQSSLPMYCSGHLSLPVFRPMD